LQKLLSKFTDFSVILGRRSLTRGFVFFTVVTKQFGSILYKYNSHRTIQKESLHAML
jgi:hypothetical protein